MANAAHTCSSSVGCSLGVADGIAKYRPRSLRSASGVSRHLDADAYVRRFDLALRAPDALHLAVVQRLDLSLITLDRRLATAARELGVGVEMPANA